MKVLKIGASWCPGCKIMIPIWQDIEKENPWLKTEMITIDENPESMKKYELHQLPTFIFLDNNDKEILRMTGEVEKEELLKIIKENKDK